MQLVAEDILMHLEKENANLPSIKHSRNVSGILKLYDKKETQNMIDKKIRMLGQEEYGAVSLN